MAFPARFVISPQIIGTKMRAGARKACKYDAVDLEMKAKDPGAETSARSSGHRLGTL